MERLGQAEEVANVIAFLASDEASYMYGAAVTVDAENVCNFSIRK